MSARFTLLDQAPQNGKTLILARADRMAADALTDLLRFQEIAPLVPVD